jgi:hypothetical protein
LIFIQGFLRKNMGNYTGKQDKDRIYRNVKPLDPKPAAW